HDSTPPSSHYLFFTLPPPPELYTLLLHDALPILAAASGSPLSQYHAQVTRRDRLPGAGPDLGREPGPRPHRPVGDRGRQQVAGQDRKSTCLNSSHDQISYAVFCLKKKTQKTTQRC